VDLALRSAILAGLVGDIQLSIGDTVGPYRILISRVQLWFFHMALFFSVILVDARDRFGGRAFHSVMLKTSIS
jgi:hypothetical protein